MKIVSINEKYSKLGEIAILTEPVLSGPNIYDKLRDFWNKSAVLHSTPFKLEASFLVIRISVVTPEIAQEVQKLLDLTEQSIHQDEDAARQQAEAQKQEERKRVEAAAKAFGVPIK